MNPEDEVKKDIYSERQYETAGKAAVEVLKLIGKADNMIPLSKKPEDEPMYDRAYQEVLGEMLIIFSNHNVGFTDYKFVENAIRAVIDSIFTTLNNHKTTLHREYMSRSVEARNPFNNKYDIEFCTHSQLVEKLLKLREEQGDNPSDFYEVTGKPDDVVSPIQQEDLKEPT